MALNRQIAKGYNSWAGSYYARIAHLAKLRHAVGYMMRRKRAKGMVTWKRYAELRKLPRPVKPEDIKEEGLRLRLQLALAEENLDEARKWNFKLEGGSGA